MHRRAATWFEQKGFAADAIKHMLAAQDLEEAARLIQLHGWTLLVQGQGQMVRSWFKLLPEKLLLAHPYLLTLHAGLLFGANDIEAAQRTMAMAETAFAASGPSEHTGAILGFAALMRANIARARGDIAACIEFARQAYELLSPQEVVQRSVAMFGIALKFRVTGDMGPTNEQMVGRRHCRHPPRWQFANPLQCKVGIGRIPLDARTVAPGSRRLSPCQRSCAPFARPPGFHQWR